MSSKRQIGRPRVFHLQNLLWPHNNWEWFCSCVHCWYMLKHTVNLKKGGPTFLKFTQMQYILFLSSFVYPRPFLAFLCFVLGPGQTINVWRPNMLMLRWVSKRLKHVWSNTDQTINTNRPRGTAEQAWYACPHQTCLIRGCPNEQNIAHQTREQKK